MSAGALSIGAYLLDMNVISKILFISNIGSYLILWVLTFIR